MEIPKDNIIIIGAGGHAKVIIDILIARGNSILCCLVNGQEKNSSLFGIPILNENDNILQRLIKTGYKKAHVAIGCNKRRLENYQKMEKYGFELVNAIHPMATISNSVLMGNGVSVMAGAIVNSSTSIGNGVIINSGAIVDHDCDLGEFSHIGPKCGLCGNVEIGKGTLIGVGSNILPGKIIGNWSVVGAGTLILENVPENVTFFGVPGKIYKRQDKKS